MALPTDELFDVLIVGAGPTGTTCALALKDAGLKVALIDKATFPRDKVCGDAIPGRSVNVLKEINPNYFQKFEHLQSKRNIVSTRFVAPGGNEANIRWKTPAYNCARLEFDAFLLNLTLQETSTHFFPDTKIIGVDIQENVVLLTTTQGNLSGKILVACDGAQSILARKLAGFSVDRDHYCGAVRAYYQGIEGIQEGVNEVFFSKKNLPGYFWVFPVNETQANVGFGMLSKTISEKSVRLTSAFFEVIEEFPELKSRFSNARILGKPEGFGLPLGTRELKISGNRFLLCGDAASLIDPVSGDGIGNSMVSAKFAAAHIIKHTQENKFSDTINKEYDLAVYKKLGKELRTNTKVLRWASALPWLPGLGISLISEKNPLSALFRKLL